MTQNITTIKSRQGDFTWINIVNARKKEIDYLKRKFKFHDLDLRDSFASQYAQRPKFHQGNGYAFLIMQFPVYNPKTRNVEPEEIDFFIGKDYLISVHKNDLPPMVELTNLCLSDEFYREQYLSGGNAGLLYELINQLQEYCYPMLDHLSLDIKSIEKNIFAGHERRMVTEILYVKRNILNFRKIMEAHKNVIQKISREKIKYFPAEKLKLYYNDLIENTKSIWETLEGQKQTIEALEDTNSSLLTFKTNDIMRILTIFSVVVFPLTLLAGIFGMNTVNGMPFMHSPNGFWFIMALMAGCSIIMFVFFKRKKWL